jgi:T4 bacteriophage base plate protein
MSLPRQRLPQYTLTLPSTGQKVIFQPFTVHEETLLLMAIDEDEESQIRALRQVLDHSIVSPKLDIYKLPIFDIDYIWLKIRSKSIEEIATLPFECRNPLPDGKVIVDSDGEERDWCGTVVNVAINLDTIEVKRNPENNPKIELFEGIGIILEYPTFEIYQKLIRSKLDNDYEAEFAVIMESIQMIYETKTGKTYEREHIDKVELKEFLESLMQPQMDKIMKFFETLPVVKHQVHFKCPKCKHEADVILEGTKSFLASDLEEKI